MARALGPTDRGEYSLALLIPGLFLTLTSFGLGEASAILIGQNRYPIERVVGSLLTYNILISVCLAGVYFGFSHLIVALTHNNIHMQLYSLGFLYIPLMLFWGNLSAVSLGLGQVRQVGYGRLLNNAIFLALIVALYFTVKLTPIMTLWFFIAGGVVEIGYLIYYVRRQTRLALFFDLDIMKEQMKFGVKFMLGGIFSQLNRRLNSYLVVLYLGNYWRAYSPCRPACRSAAHDSQRLRPRLVLSLRPFKKRRGASDSRRFRTPDNLLPAGHGRRARPYRPPGHNPAVHE